MISKRNIVVINSLLGADQTWSTSQLPRADQRSIIQEDPLEGRSVWFCWPRLSRQQSMPPKGLDFLSNPRRLTARAILTNDSELSPSRWFIPQFLRGSGGFAWLRQSEPPI